MKQLQALNLIQSCIEKEFAEFRDEIIFGNTKELFDRAQEIIIKTNIAAEILSGFEDLQEYGATKESISSIIQTLVVRLQDPEEEEEDILDSIYQDFLIFIPVLFDPSISGEFFLEYYDKSIGDTDA